MCCETGRLKITVEGIDFDTDVLDDVKQFILFAEVDKGIWVKGAASLDFLTISHSALGEKIFQISQDIDEALATLL